MLSDVLAGAETGGFVLIRDTASYSGRQLLKYLINCAIKREDPVHVLGFDVPEKNLCLGLDSNYVHLVYFHSAFSDPLGWNKHSTFTVKQFCSPDIVHLVHDAQQTKPSVLVIDSLSWVVRHQDPGTVCQELLKLKRDGSISLLIGLLHMDLHQQGIVGSISHLASTVISVTLMTNAHYALAKSSRRKKSGKVIYEEELFSLTEDLTLSIQNRPSQSGHVQIEVDTNQVDPTLNLTFNLRLSETEREAKEKVTLPFVFSQEKKSALLRPSQGTGRIMYEPDASDDFDDEDPDDDLDV